MTKIRYIAGPDRYEVKMALDRQADGSCDVFFYARKLRRYDYGFSLKNVSSLDDRDICRKAIQTLEAMVAAHEFLHTV